MKEKYITTLVWLRPEKYEPRTAVITSRPPPNISTLK